MVVHSWGTFVYAPPECMRDGIVVPPREEIHHLRDVLRMKPGQPVHATDGAGMVYRCEIQQDFSLGIHERLPEFGETPQPVSLAVGILKGDGNRDVVDIATQLGARRILFIDTARSEGKLAEHKLERLERAAISAIKQCGRARLPEIRVYKSVSDMLASRDPSTALLLAQQTHAEDRKQPETAAGSNGAGMLICVGPEGGFDDEEIRLFREAGARCVTLAGRRLRTAAAVGAALSYCLHVIGEMHNY